MADSAGGGGRLWRLAATAAFHAVPPLLRVAIGGWRIAWHGSLQHETIHGQPTALHRLNDMIGGLVYRGYCDIARRFLVRRHDAIVHPDHCAAEAA